MKRKHIAFGTILVLMLGAYSILVLELGDTSKPDIAPGAKYSEEKPEKKSEKTVAARTKSKAHRSMERFESRAEDAALPEIARRDPPEPEKKAGSEAVSRPRHIEEIKEEIYKRQIDSVDQIALLDDLVQTGNQDTRQFWGDGWTSADDWKKENNGFSLEKKDDGTMVFNPDEATASKYTFFENPLSYTYDEVNREFVSEVDYYGKTIYNVAKFIKEDVLVMMTISGTKVDLNIYQKDANQQAAIR